MASIVCAQFLKSEIRIRGLVRGVGVHEGGSLIGHDLFQDRRDGLALGEPLPTNLGQQLGRVGLVEQDRARRPAVGKSQTVEIVENSGRGGSRESDDRQDAQMRGPQARLEAACQSLIREQRVEIDWGLGHPHPMALRRDRRMQVGQGLGAVEPGAFGHEAVEKRDNAIGPIDKAVEDLMGVETAAVASLVEPRFRASRILGRRQIGDGEEIA